MQSQNETYEFGPFRLDPEKRRLFREGEQQPVDLTPKVFDTLLLLVRNCDRVLDKKELMDTLWPDSFVEESNLFQNVSTLRKALGESPQDHQYVVTVPGRGYRFVAQVKQTTARHDLTVLPSERLQGTNENEDQIIVSERIRSRVIVHDENGRLANNTSLAALPAAADRPFTGTLKWLALVLVLPLIAGIVLAVFRWSSKGTSVSFVNPRLVKLTTTGNIIASAISPDGRDFAYVLAEAGKESLWIKQVSASSASVEIAQPAEATFHGLTFSPDGNHIYYVVSGEGSENPSTIYRVPALGGRTLRLFTDVDGPLTLSPDGNRMAYIRGYPDEKLTALMVGNVDGTGERRLSTIPEAQGGFVLYAGPSWSPDGKTIVSAGKRNDTNGPYQTLLSVNVETGDVSTITETRWRQVGRVCWAPDNLGLFFLASDQDSGLFQVWYAGYPGGQVKKITNDLSDYRDITVTRDGKKMVAIQTSRQSNIWLSSSESAEPVQITNNNYDGLSGLAWTPDNHLLFTSVSQGNETLWVADSQGAKSQLTSTEGNDRAPVSSPDGRHVVFSSDRSGRRHLWQIENDGGQPIELTAGVDDSQPAFSPDGRFILYRSYNEGIPNVFRINADGGTPIRLTEGITGYPVIAPDGKTFAATYRERALTEVSIALFSLDGGKLLKTFSKPTGPPKLIWTNDGTALLYLRTINGVSNVWRQPIDGSAAQQLTKFGNYLIYWFDQSRDGRLAFARGTRSSDVVLVSEGR